VAEWTIDPRVFAKSTIDNIEKVRRIYAFEIFKRVVQRTPVDTGNARSNWLVSLGEQTDEYNPAMVTKRKITRGKNKGKTATKVKLNQTLNRTMRAGGLGITFSGDDSIVIFNNTPYIRKLEYGGYPNPPKHGGKTKEYTRKDGTKVGGLPKTVGGYSLQAPHGIVGLVLAQAEQIFQKAINAVNGGGS
jgi:hypothetical protein